MISKDHDLCIMCLKKFIELAYARSGTMLGKLMIEWQLTGETLTQHRERWKHPFDCDLMRRLEEHMASVQMVGRFIQNLKA